MISTCSCEGLAAVSARAEGTEAKQLSVKSELFGVAYSQEPFRQLEESLCSWLRGNRSRGASIGYVNPHVFNLAWQNERVRTFLSLADMVTVDGLGMALAIRLFKGWPQTRTVMTPLFDAVLANETLPALRATLIGGTEAVAHKGAAAINRMSRRIEVIAQTDGYQPLEQYLLFLRQYPQADVVLVAMGSPRSEELILAARAAFPDKLFWNIGGGTLHFHAGTQPRVPSMVSKLGTQWLWRIVHEPRIAPRYFVGIPVFAAHLLRAGFIPKKAGA